MKQATKRKVTKAAAKDFRPPLTVPQILRELRCQRELHKLDCRKADSAIMRENAMNACEALTFAVNFIKRHKIRVETLQAVIDQHSARKGALEHYR